MQDENSCSYKTNNSNSIMQDSADQQTHHFETQWASSTAMATIPLDISGISITSLYFEFTNDSGTQYKRLDFDKSSLVAMSSGSTLLSEAVRIAALTFLHLRLSTWSTISEIRGETTITSWLGMDSLVACVCEMWKSCINGNTW